MRILFVGEEGLWASLAWRCFEIEGHDCRLFLDDKDSKEVLKGMVQHVSSLQEGLLWVGKRGIIIRDDEQDVSALRKAGYRIYGNNAWSKRLELDRLFQLETCKVAGLAISDFHTVKSILEAIEFIKNKPDAYAIKQVGLMAKTLNYVGKEDDGSDCIHQLEWMLQAPELAKFKDKASFILQEVVSGIEVGTSGWWLGQDWLRYGNGEIVTEINFENKKVADSDLGLTCGEAATIMRMQPAGKLFKETLEKLTPVLRKNAADVIVNVDANCGVVEEGGKSKAYLFELCVRQGYPAATLQEHLLDIDCSDFFDNLVDGNQGFVDHKSDWGEVLVMGSGHYPSETDMPNHTGSYYHQPVYAEWSEHLLPFWVMYDEKAKIHRVACDYEWVCGAVASGPDILKNNERCVEILREEITTRDPIYRLDIGEKEVEKKLPELKRLGYL